MRTENKTSKKLSEAEQLFRAYKRNQLKIAKQLCYSKAILDRISESNTEQQILSAMKDGRMQMRNA